MDRHPFEPLAAVLGLLVIALGVTVAVFGVERADAAVVVAVIAGAAGLALIPWRGARSGDDDGDAERHLRT